MTYNDAYALAREQARRYKRPMGLEKTLDGKAISYVVKMIPKDPARRFGWELRVQVVEPNE